MPSTGPAYSLWQHQQALRLSSRCGKVGRRSLKDVNVGSRGQCHESRVLGGRVWLVKPSVISSYRQAQGFIQKWSKGGCQLISPENWLVTLETAALRLQVSCHDGML